MNQRFVEVIEDMSQDVYMWVFEILDGYFLEHEMTAMEAGQIATLVKQQFCALLQHHFSIEDKHGQES